MNVNRRKVYERFVIRISKIPIKGTQYFIPYKLRSHYGDDFAQEFYDEVFVEKSLKGMDLDFYSYAKLYDTYEKALSGMRKNFYDDCAYTVFKVHKGKVKLVN